MEPNNPEDEVMEGVVDETPVFLSAEDAVEVQVDEATMPMQEEDDNDQVEQEESADMTWACIDAHTGPAYTVTTSYNDNTLHIVSGGGDDKSFVHSVRRGGTSATTTALSHPHTDSVSSVALNLNFIDSNNSKNDTVSKPPPESVLAVGGYDGAIVLYNPNDPSAQPRVLEGPSDVEWLSFHPTGTVLLAGSAADGTVWMYHVPLQKCMQVFVGHESAVTAGCFTPDGRWPLSCSTDGTLRVWAPKTGQCRHVFRLSTESGLTCIGIRGGSDGQLVIVGGEDGQAHVCHVGNKKVVASLRHYEVSNTIQRSNDEEELMELPTSVEAVAFAGVNPNWCATGGVDGVLKIWDLSNNGQCRQVCRHEQESSGITRIRWHPTLPMIVSAYTNGVVRIWDARNGAIVHSLTSGSAEVLNDLDVQWIEGSALIVTASEDGKIRTFEVDLAATAS